ncbi:MAG: type II secretion system F family protein, partial [Planctomycetia bacterium]
MVPGREMPRKLLADMLGRLAVALAAGIGLRRCWRMEVSRVPAAWRPAMEKVAAAIEAGEPLADAMAAAGAAFPPFVRGMVAVGDRTGREVETLREVSQTLERGVRTAQAMRRSLAGPLGQLAVAVVVVGLLI